MNEDIQENCYRCEATKKENEKKGEIKEEKTIPVEQDKYTATAKERVFTVCANCDNEIAEGQAYCENCHAKTVVTICQNCKIPVGKDAKLCGECGALLTDAIRKSTKAKRYVENDGRDILGRMVLPIFSQREAGRMKTKTMVLPIFPQWKVGVGVGLFLILGVILFGAEIINRPYRPSQSEIATFRQWGVLDKDMVSYSLHVKSVGKVVGLTSKEVTEYMSAGAQVSQQLGLLGVTGANIAAYGLLSGHSMLKSGVTTVGRMASSVRQNRSNSAEIAALYGQKTTWELISLADSPTGRFLLVAMSKKGEGCKYTLDSEFYKKYLDGEISWSDVERIAESKMGKDVVLCRKTGSPLRLLEEIMSSDDGETNDIVGKWTPMIFRAGQQFGDGLVARGFEKKEAEIIATDDLANSSVIKARMRELLERYVLMTNEKP